MVGPSGTARLRIRHKRQRRGQRNGDLCGIPPPKIWRAAVNSHHTPLEGATRWTCPHLLGVTGEGGSVGGGNLRCMYWGHKKNVPPAEGARDVAIRDPREEISSGAKHEGEGEGEGEVYPPHPRRWWWAAYPPVWWRVSCHVWCCLARCQHNRQHMQFTRRKACAASIYPFPMRYSRATRALPEANWPLPCIPPSPRVQRTMKSSKNKVRTGVFVGHTVRLRGGRGVGAYPGEGTAPLRISAAAPPPLS